MRSALTAVSQVAVMAAIVATLLYLPVGVVLALTLPLFGISLEALATFGGTLNMAFGLLLWWLLAFTGAGAYAASVYPWTETRSWRAPPP
jgi:hypothetical protein